MKSEINSFIVVFILIFLCSFFIKEYFLPSGILYTLPSFQKNVWITPHNSLLADPVFQFEPWRIFAKKELLEGRIPLINYLNGSGSPFFANPQTAVLYPLQLFYYLFPVPQGLFLLHMMKLFFLFLFSYLFFKSLKYNKFVYILCSSGVTFAAFPLMWLQWPHTNVYIFFPLLLFCINKLKNNTTNNIRWYSVITISTTFCIFGGHPETLFHMLLVTSSYGVYVLWKQKDSLIKYFLSIILGFGLGSIQLVPFFEYLFSSYAWTIRNQGTYQYFLSPITYIFNIFPVILGLPQYEFYKPFSSTQNFQEVAGGYVGIIFFLLAIISVVFLFKKINFVKFWGILIILCWAIIYNVPPFSIVVNLPIVHSLANSRLLVFSGFGIIVLAGEFLNRYLHGQIKITPFTRRIIKRILIGSSVLILFCLLILNNISLPNVPNSFIKQLSVHTIFLAYTTILGVYVLLHKTNFVWKIILFICIISQSLGLFWDYNAFSSKNDYYPETKVIQTLNKLPSGAFVEIGNPNLPENINISYNLSHIENYDAMENAKYKATFKNTFPNQNHWGNPDSTTRQGLDRFGIHYVLSDYDINLKRQVLNDNHNKILSFLDKNEYIINFTPEFNNLKQVRILPANYNRANSCFLYVKLLKSQQVIAAKHISCHVFPDNKFYTFNFFADIEKNEKYAISFSLINGGENNKIGLWGDKENLPYVTILYSNKIDNGYINRWNSNNIFLFEITKPRYIEFNGLYTIIEKLPDRTTLFTNAKKDTNLTIKIPSYPGWRAFIDGRRVSMNENVFLSVMVGKGQHIVKFQYIPTSFYFGILITLLTLLSIFICIFRISKNSKVFKKLFVKWNYLVKLKSGNNDFIEFVKIFLITFTISCLLFFITLVLFPIDFKPVSTMTINWYTVHGYPKQQDYFYFKYGFGFILFSTLLLTFLWKIKQKK